MNWSLWIRENYDGVRRVIRSVGWNNHVRGGDIEDFTSRVFVRLLSSPPRATDGRHWQYVKVIAKRQAVDDTRLRMRRPQTVALEGDWVRGDAFAEVEVLDQVRRLGSRDGKAILGPALGFQDAELAEEGVTRDAVSQRRRRARERLAA